MAAAAISEALECVSRAKTDPSVAAAAAEIDDALQCKQSPVFDEGGFVPPPPMGKATADTESKVVA